ncbi:NUDIX domain-containing protein [Nocardioides sp.]|jgi:8-oxo-dGTP pyrophosphatase MutT (NUDIX family)|uniref:NUDIX domain-containing protein n=1 Tax=Nocardioides sp. TaxID=35761 RepID=UPI002BE1C512|nr:NUDIX domain-containing protein [Nocardioides sp.]HVX55510.1 NUDIX domain-containing protein [Nocardioides sp.]
MTLDRFVVVPAAYVFLLRPGTAGTEVLLQRRGDVPFMAGHWGAGAAGHVERGETAFDAATREAVEEIGVTDVDLTFLTSMQRTAGGEPIDERVDFFFTARAWSGEPRIMESAKATDLGWFPLSALPEPTVPHEAMVLGLLARDAVPPYLTFGF